MGLEDFIEARKDFIKDNKNLFIFLFLNLFFFFF